MGQKAHPVALRLNQNRTFDSSWYSDSYSSFLKDDFLIRKAINSFFGILKFSFYDFSIGRVFYQKSSQKLILSIFFYKKKNQEKSFRYRLFIRYSNKKRKALSRFTQNYFIDSKWSDSVKNLSSNFIENLKTSPSHSTFGMKLLSSFLKKKKIISLSNKWTLFQSLFSKSSFQKDFLSFMKFATPSRRLVKQTKTRTLNTSITKKAIKGNRRKSKNLCVQSSNSFFQNYYLNAFSSVTNNLVPFHIFGRYFTRSVPRVHEYKNQKLLMYKGNANTLANFQKSGDSFRLTAKEPKLHTITKLPIKSKMPSKPAKFLSSLKSHPFLSRFENSLSSLLGFNVYVYPIKSTIPTQSAHFLADKIVSALQKDQKERTWKILKTVLRDSLYLEKCTGIRILCSGRLAGVELAKKYSFKRGQTSLNVFSQKIDFIQKTALTKYGIIGVKVWISYN